MFLTVNTDDPRAIYQQVADGIKELIARGELPEGTALPPVRQLAADLTQLEQTDDGTVARLLATCGFGPDPQAESSSRLVLDL